MFASLKEKQENKKVFKMAVSSVLDEELHKLPYVEYLVEDKVILDIFFVLQDVKE